MLILPILGSTTVVKVSQNRFSYLTIDDLAQNLSLTFDEQFSITATLSQYIYVYCLVFFY